MTAQVIDGKAIAKARKEELIKKISELKEKGVEPFLASLSIGDDPSWNWYANKQKKSCESVAIKYEEYNLPESSSFEDTYELLEKLNKDDAIHGIIIQSPLPKEFQLEKLRSMMLPSKDIEGVGLVNIGAVTSGSEDKVPCTAKAAVELADTVLPDMNGIDAVVIGRSVIVGKPAANLLLNRGATVTICHSKTKDIKAHTKRADLVVVGVGAPSILTADMLSPNTVVIDVGINQVIKDGKSKMVGDVDESVWDIASHLTPVPGGVGALTTITLLEATVNAAR